MVVVVVVVVVVVAAAAVAVAVVVVVGVVVVGVVGVVVGIIVVVGGVGVVVGAAAVGGAVGAAVGGAWTAGEVHVEHQSGNGDAVDPNRGKRCRKGCLQADSKRSNGNRARFKRNKRFKRVWAAGGIVLHIHGMLTHKHRTHRANVHGMVGPGRGKLCGG